jgi:hypothetical protein
MDIDIVCSPINQYEKLREVAYPSIMAQRDKIVFIPTDEDRFAPTGKRNIGKTEH